MLESVIYQGIGFESHHWCVFKQCAAFTDLSSTLVNLHAVRGNNLQKHTNHIDDLTLHNVLNSLRTMIKCSDLPRIVSPFCT